VKARARSRKSKLSSEQRVVELSTVKKRVPFDSNEDRLASAQFAVDFLRDNPKESYIASTAGQSLVVATRCGETIHVLDAKLLRQAVVPL